MTPGAEAGRWVGSLGSTGAKMQSLPDPASARRSLQPGAFPHSQGSVWFSANAPRGIVPSHPGPGQRARKSFKSSTMVSWGCSSGARRRPSVHEALGLIPARTVNTFFLNTKKKSLLGTRHTIARYLEKEATNPPTTHPSHQSIGLLTKSFKKTD